MSFLFFHNSFLTRTIQKKFFVLIFFLMLFTMPTAYSQSTAATIPAIDTKAKEVLAKVQNLLDGNESLYKISLNSKLQTVGLFADCSDPYFSVPGNACIFSVDTIRLKQNSDTTGKIVAVCVDNVDFNSKPPIVNCTPLTVDLSVLTNSQGVGASFGLSGKTTTPAGVTLEIGAGVGVSLEWENGVFQRQPLTIPLPKSAGLEFSGQKSGGNALTDGGFDPILSSKFVILKTQDIEGEVEFTGTFPSKMKLVLGNFHDGISNPVCNDKKGNTDCPDNFSNVLKSINTFSTPQVFSAKYTPATSETTFTFVDYNNNQHNPFSSKITKIGLVVDSQTQTVIDTVNDLIAQGDLSPRTGRSILWLLNAANTLEMSGDTEGAISKLNSATQRINLFVQRNIIDQNSAQSILSSIQNAKNNIENPPGDGDPDITSPFFGQNIKEDISQLNALSESVVDEVVEIDQATNALAKLVDRGLGDKLLEITLNEIKKIPNIIPKIVEKFVGGVDAISNIGEIKTVIGEAKSTVDDVERGVDTILTDLDNAFMFSTSCPEGTTTVGVGPAALCTTQPSCPTGTAPNNAGTECVIRTGGSFPACPSGSVDNLVGECGPAPTPSTCPSGFI